MGKPNPIPKDRINTNENLEKANDYMRLVNDMGKADKNTMDRIEKSKEEKELPENQCRWCDFEAKNKMGRIAHERAKHPKKYKNSKN